MNKKSVLSFLLILVLMLGMMFFLTGCGNEDKDEDDKDDSKKKAANEAVEIYEEANSTVSKASAQMAKQEIDMFNATFKKYEGSGKKGSDVKLLVDDVISHNLSYSDEEDKQVSIEFDGETYSEASEMRSNVKNKIATGKSYDVSLEKDSRGVVETVVIE